MIELVKLLICMNEGIDICCPFYYAGMERSLLGGKSLVFALQTDHGFAEKRYPLKKCLDAVRPQMPKVERVIGSPTDEWPHVDRAYMLRALEACGLVQPLDAAP